MSRRRERADVIGQIASLRRRLDLIRWMQAAGIASILLCVITMFLVYAGVQFWAQLLFAASLLLLMCSLVLTLIETFLSAGALRLLLRDLEA